MERVTDEVIDVPLTRSDGKGAEGAEVMLWKGRRSMERLQGRMLTVT